MSFSAFFFLVLGLYAAYYLILFVVDRFSSRSHGANSAPETVYAFAPPDPMREGRQATAIAKDQLHPLTYLPSTDPLEEAGEDPELDLVHLADDVIEAEREWEDATIMQPGHGTQPNPAA